MIEPQILLLSILLISIIIYEFKDNVLIGLHYIIPVFLPLDKHVTIIGPTRSGKTTTAKRIVKRSRIKTIVLDWNGEYDYGVKVPANALTLDLSKLSKKLISELIGLSLDLNEPSIYFLYRAIKDYIINNFDDILNALDSYLTTTKSETEMKAAIMRRVEYVVDAIRRGKIPMELILKTKKNIIIDLSFLTLIEEKILISLLVLAYLYNYFQHAGVSLKPRLFVVIDEAQNILERGAVVRHLITEIAKYGVRLILVTNILPPRELLVHTNVIITKSHYFYDSNIKEPSIIISDKPKKITKFI